jgi:hypothetical protein
MTAIGELSGEVKEDNFGSEQPFEKDTLVGGAAEGKKWWPQ